MARKRKIKWEEGDVFAIPLMDNKSFAIGQVLDNPMVNIIRIAVFDERINSLDDIDLDKLCNKSNLISAVQSSKEQIDYGVWHVIGNKKSRPMPMSEYPCEQFRSSMWVGAKIYDAALVEDFVNAFYGFEYWDDWYDPNYLDAFLIDKSKKPKKLKIKGKE